MCKILTIVGINPKKVANAWKFAFASLPYMTKYDNDGLGYAAYSSEGGLFAERWMHTKDAFKNRESGTVQDVRLRAALKDACQVDASYDSHGALLSDSVTTIAMHARMATCGHSLANTHPFISGNTALIHNGVIRNTSELTNITSTCDSECILNEYTKQGVSDNPECIQGVAHNLQGYYACAVIDATKKQIDIFRDNKATLYGTYCEQVGGVILCTTKDILISTFKALKWKLGQVVELQSGKLLRLDLVTGKHVSTTGFVPEYKSTSFRFNDAGLTNTADDDGPTSVDEYLRDPYYYRSGS